MGLKLVRLLHSPPSDYLTVANQVKVTLCVSYPDGYPDVLPNLSLQAEETDFNENDVQGLINDLRAVVCTPNME